MRAPVGHAASSGRQAPTRATAAAAAAASAAAAAAAAAAASPPRLTGDRSGYVFPAHSGSQRPPVRARQDSAAK